ncbi:hypothetical protein [Burkholderia gladioli]|uniref:hypothetical protein n=1 Tax=Burkholderia gladioli TaxID=28095 RepID=UPI00163FD68E|nr:hypothetical protein [Burkholderia gladioli]
MNIEAAIWLFRVRQCGYYKNKINNGKPPLFGSLDSIFGDLIRWSSNKNLGETSTNDLIEDGDLGKTYLLHASKGRGGDYLVGIWNRINSNSNKIASVGSSDKVGAAETKFTEIDEDRIPGFATYFWVMPGEEAIATVRIKHASNGIQNFQSYMQNFVTYFDPQHIVPEDGEEEDEITILGYRPTPKSDIVAEANPRFEVKSIINPGDTAFILENRDRIRRVICKTTLTNTVRADRTWWQRGLGVLNMGIGEKILSDKVNIKVDLPLSFTKGELELTIQEWQKHLAETKSAWDDLGFVFTGDQTPKWLSKSYARQNFDLDIQWIDDEQVDPTSLMMQLQRHRKAVLLLG